MGSLSIKADIRDRVGTGSARALRRAGRVPCVIYSSGKEGTPISLSIKDTEAVCHRFDAMTNVVDIDVNGKVHKVLARQISTHPVTDRIEHVDFFGIDGSDEIVVSVPIKITGRENSAEIKRGGVVNMARRSLRCRVNRENIPEIITIDVSNVKMGVPVTLSDISLPSGASLIDKDLKLTVLKITGKRSKAMTEEVDEETSEEGSEEENKEQADS